MVSDHSNESLSLDDVKRRFVDAEEQLQRLAAANAELQSESEALAEANAAVRDAGIKVSDLSDTLRDLAGAMKQATEAVQQLDPAIISGQLGRLEIGNADVGEDVGEIKQAQDSLGTAVNRLRTYVFVGLSLGVAIAVLLVLLLVR